MWAWGRIKVTRRPYTPGMGHILTCCSAVHRFVIHSVFVYCKYVICIGTLPKPIENACQRTTYTPYQCNNVHSLYIFWQTLNDLNDHWQGARGWKKARPPASCSARCPLRWCVSTPWCCPPASKTVISSPLTSMPCFNWYILNVPFIFRNTRFHLSNNNLNMHESLHWNTSISLSVYLWIPNVGDLDACALVWWLSKGCLNMEYE